jgi:hypothetical protein
VDGQVEGVVRDIFAGTIDRGTRDAMRAAGTASASPNGDRRLRDVLALALASPDFQRR